MKSLLLLLSLLPAAPQDGWWNAEWKHRRRIAIRNYLEQPLPAGYTLQIEIAADYLGIGEKSQKRMEDWRLVRENRTIPFTLFPGRAKNSVLLTFRTAADLAARGSDDRYALYYGNAAAPAEPAGPGEVFELWEDFSRAESIRERFEVDKDLGVGIHDGRLALREVAAGYTEPTPARLVFKNLPASPGFEISFDLEVLEDNPAGLGIALQVDMKEPAANDPTAAKRLAEEIERLGDPDWEVREKATKQLIQMGKPALARLMEATRSGDAEVKWRAEHILKEIRERFPSPTIAAGVFTGDPTPGSVMLVSTIGKNRARVPWRPGFPARLRVTLRRDTDGDVTLLWNDRHPQSGSMPGEIRQVAFTIFKSAGAPLGTVRIDNLQIRRYVDEQEKPTSTVDVEESRP